MQGGQTKRGSSCREGKREKSKEIDIKKDKGQRMEWHDTVSTGRGSYVV
jgi:hypothetical protein